MTGAGDQLVAERHQVMFALPSGRRLMNKFGPTRGELKFRIVVSILGLAFMGFAIWHRGIPDGPALVEVVGLAGVFFGGTLVLSVRRLIQVNKEGM
jgi:hypothetical protein